MNYDRPVHRNKTSHSISIDSLVTHNSDGSGSSIPLHSYSFNPDLYDDNMVSLPTNILRPVSKRDQDISIPEHMPHWNYHEFNVSEQRDFVIRHFPNRKALYKKLTTKERTELFTYLWMYLNGGVYISPTYELVKPLDSLLQNLPPVDLYFIHDVNKNISSEFFASQPFCDFWMEVVDLMELGKKTKVLTKALENTRHTYQIILEVEPYCSNESYLKNTVNDFVTTLSCQTGYSSDVIYYTGAIIVVVCLLFISALITN